MTRRTSSLRSVKSPTRAYEFDAGIDLCLSDFEMVECEYDHTFHIDCAGLN